MDDGFSLDPAAIRAAREAARRSAATINATAAQIEMELVRFDGQNAPIDLNVDLSKETIWATQQQIADLFGKDRDTIGHHLAGVYEDGEAEREATTANYAVVRLEGGRTVSREVTHYNLDVILSVGYRVSSARATEFRKWASQILRRYLTDGYALNEARLRSDPNALRELAAKVRELRANEANLYHAVRDVFAFATTDYDGKSQIARSFFARIQDKFVYAITDKNTGEILLSRADHNKPNMAFKR